MTRNKLVSLGLAFLVAIVLWAYVVTTVAPDDSQWIYDIPVTFINEDGLFADRNLTLTEGRNATVNLRFHGKRQDLLRLNNTNVVITADLSQITATGEQRISYEYELPDTVSVNSISIDARSAYYITVLVDKLSTKPVEVRTVFEGSVADDYVAENIEVDNETIELSGPKDIVDTVAYAQVVLERTNLSRSVSDSLAYVLMDAEGNEVQSDEIHCSVDKINVYMPVSMVKTIPLTAELIDGGGATSDNAVVTIEPATITIKGDAEILETLNSLAVDKVNLANVQGSYTKEVNVVIPDGTVNLSDDALVTVNVELVNLKTSTFRTTNIEFINVPEGLQATLGTTSLQVQVRGTTEVVDEIIAANIRAVVDLSAIGSSKGQFKINASIYIDGYTGVGALGTYSVLVTLSEPVEEEAAVEVSRATEEPADTEESPSPAVPTATTIPEDPQRT